MVRTPRRRAALTRRDALAVAGSALVLGGLAGCGRDGGGDVRAAARADNILGDPNAPVTIIEYASVTCPHCKAFHDEVFPELRARYIDTGQVCFVFREMPTNPPALAMAGFLVARCAPEERYFDVLDVLFERQTDLVRAYQTGAAREELLKIARPLGLDEERFDACVRDETEIQRIRQINEDAVANGVSLTPTLVINGQAYPAMGIEQLSEVLDPLIDQG